MCQPVRVQGLGFDTGDIQGRVQLVKNTTKSNLGAGSGDDTEGFTVLLKNTSTNLTLDKVSGCRICGCTRMGQYEVGFCSGTALPSLSTGQGVRVPGLVDHT